MSLLSTEERSSFGSTYNDLFDALKRQIVVHKQPLKNIVSSVNSAPMFGYPTDSLPDTVTYTPVTGVFDARIFYPQRKDDVPISSIEIKNPFAACYIRVKEEAKDFIVRDRTEKITFDEKAWNVNIGYKVHRYIDEVYYEFNLIEVV